MPFSNGTGGLPPPSGELLAAFGAALVAAYVRAKSDPRPWSLRSVAARGAEAVVCASLAIGAASLMEWTDPRATVGVSAALGLLGTQAITDLLLRAAARRAGDGKP